MIRKGGVTLRITVSSETLHYAWSFCIVGRWKKEQFKVSFQIALQNSSHGITRASIDQFSPANVSIITAVTGVCKMIQDFPTYVRRVYLEFEFRWKSWNRMGKCSVNSQATGIIFRFQLRKIGQWMRAMWWNLRVPFVHANAQIHKSIRTRCIYSQSVPHRSICIFRNWR